MAGSGSGWSGTTTREAEATNGGAYIDRVRLLGLRTAELHLALGGEHLVSIPMFDGIAATFTALPSPEWSVLRDTGAWMSVGAIAIIASIETLLCVEAIDQLDPLKRRTPPNRELFAQGIGNIVCGVLGALPMTAVIVRGSANVHSGAKSHWSAFIHGIFLVIATVFLAQYLGHIPLAALAAVLIDVGYRLADPKKLIAAVKEPFRDALPFVVTFLGILFTDLLIGTALGLATAGAFAIKDRIAGTSRSKREADESGSA